MAEPGGRGAFLDRGNPLDHCYSQVKAGLAMEFDCRGRIGVGARPGGGVVCRSTGVCWPAGGVGDRERGALRSRQPDQRLSHADNAKVSYAGVGLALCATEVCARGGIAVGDFASALCPLCF